MVQVKYGSADHELSLALYLSLPLLFYPHHGRLDVWSPRSFFFFSFGQPNLVVSHARPRVRRLNFEIVSMRDTGVASYTSTYIGVLRVLRDREESK